MQIATKKAYHQGCTPSEDLLYKGQGVPIQQMPSTTLIPFFFHPYWYTDPSRRGRVGCSAAPGAIALINSEAPRTLAVLAARDVELQAEERQSHSKSCPRAKGCELLVSELKRTTDGADSPSAYSLPVVPSRESTHVRFPIESTTAPAAQYVQVGPPRKYFQWPPA